MSCNVRRLRQRDGLPLGLATSQVVHVNGDAAEASKLAVTRDRRQGGHRWAIRRNPISDHDQTFLPQNNLAVDAVIRHRLAEQVAVTGRRLRRLLAASFETRPPDWRWKQHDRGTAKMEDLEILSFHARRCHRPD
jgi:hypothetical protein